MGSFLNTFHHIPGFWEGFENWLERFSKFNLIGAISTFWLGKGSKGEDTLR